MYLCELSVWIDSPAFEPDGQVGRRDPDDLVGARDQVHLDAAELGAVDGAVAELVEVEVGTELAVDPPSRFRLNWAVTPCESS